MGLQKCGLNCDRTRKELKPHGTVDFPCAGYSEQCTDKHEDMIPWHWHDEIELIYIKSGALSVQIPAATLELQGGDCIAINSAILHCTTAKPQCHLYSLVFSPTLITGNSDSVFAKRYVLPLLSCPSFGGIVFKAGGDQDVTHHFLTAFESLSLDSPGFEFIVRDNLSQVSFYLYQQFKHSMATGETGLNQDTLRIRKMLDYIHQNFSNNLDLMEIARAADIGVRECLRCFKRTIHLSPMQYLLKYRIMQGADFLTIDPERTVSEIAVLCGFDSPSNFSKMFKRFFKCTPRDYRMRIQPTKVSVPGP